MLEVEYVAHPVGGDIPGNVKEIKRICGRIHLGGRLPSAPYILSLEYLDDTKPEQRSLGMAGNRQVLKSGLISRIGLYGPRISPGMEFEINVGKEVGLRSFVRDPRIMHSLGYDDDQIRNGHVVNTHLVADRVLPDGTLAVFLQKPQAPQDVEIIRIVSVVDPHYGAELGLWLAGPLHGDRVYDGFSVLGERTRDMSLADKLDYTSQFFTAITRCMAQGKSVRNCLHEKGIDELVLN